MNMNIKNIYLYNKEHKGLKFFSFIAEDVEIDVESMVWTLDPDGLGLTHTDADHSYSTSGRAWL